MSCSGGSPTSAAPAAGDPPLLFYRGGYTVTQDSEPVLASLLTWHGDDTWI
jgi:hypothetical protein